MKKIYQSKTMWANVIAILLGALPLINEDVLKAIGIVNVQAYLTVLGFVMALLNLLLRSVTTSGISKFK